MNEQEWISAPIALSLLKPSMTFGAATSALTRRARDGLLRTKAKHFIQGNKSSDNMELPSEFWSIMLGPRQKHEDWTIGDFSVRAGFSGDEHWNAYGVHFDRLQVVTIIPDAPPAEPRGIPSCHVGAATEGPEANQDEQVYQEWIAQNEGKSPPNRIADRDFMRERCPLITQPRLRELRKQLAPPDWKSRGRRKN